MWPHFFCRDISSNIAAQFGLSCALNFHCMKWIGIGAAALLVVACFMIWVIIPSKNIVVTGIDSTGTNFGKPGYFHFICTFFFLVFLLLPRLWAKRSNLLVTAINLAWAVRNYFIITACREGDCPEKHLAVFLVVAASVLMLVSALFPDFKPTPRIPQS
jgi:hypothetical protein